MMFSMSRDRVLPGHGALGRVSPVTRTPVLPAVVVGALSAAILLVNVGEASLFTALTSVCIVMLYGAYLMVTVPQLIQRLRGTYATEPGHFSLGAWGLPVNVLAVAYGALQMINLAWPRAAVYDPAGQGWYLQYFSLLFVGGALLVGVVAYALHRRELREPGGTPAAGELGLEAAQA
jgi:amino acid transporter